MPQLMQKEVVQDETNVVAHALAHGTPQSVIVSPEQAASLCELLSNPKPATETLRKRFASARQFQFVAR
jgi:hypothetical protein